eukprot:3447726-Lingulodinium_polyedra.AAC.1
MHDGWKLGDEEPHHASHRVLLLRLLHDFFEVEEDGPTHVGVPDVEAVGGVTGVIVHAPARAVLEDVAEPRIPFVQSEESDASLGLQMVTHANHRAFVED